MVQYIDKDALVAEIKREINEIKINLDSIDDWHRRVQREDDIKVMKNILSLINTLEVKEVDTDGTLEFAKYLRNETGCGLMLATKCIDDLIDAIKRKPALLMDVGAKLEMKWAQYDMRKRTDGEATIEPEAPQDQKG